MTRLPTASSINRCQERGGARGWKATRAELRWTNPASVVWYENSTACGNNNSGGVPWWVLVLLLSLVVDIQTSVANLLSTAGVVASHTVNIPKLQLTPPVLNLVIEEAIIQDGYMNALTDGYTGAGESL